jgi:uncharacterized membrane-anchored protein YhcB (DUF1043 family)
MSSAAEILVIIVSVVLCIFLIVGIIIGVYLIRLSAQIRKIAKSAEQTVSSIGGAVSRFTKFTSPVFMAEMIKQMFKQDSKKK